MSDRDTYKYIWSGDPYTWKARIAPVLIALLPVGLAVYVWFPGPSMAARLAVPAGISALLLLLLSELGRDMGKRAEPKLWEDWGGAPTTQRLRFTAPGVNVMLVGRHHRLLSELIPDHALPTASEEAADPEAADQAYEVATRWLRDNTRNTSEFELVFKENTSYGFRRNLYGLKPLALPVAVVGAALCVVGGQPLTGDIEVDWAMATSGNLALTILWLAWFRPSWVRIPAEACADRLFEACERLHRSRRQ